MSEVKRVEFGSPEEFLDFLGASLGIGLVPNGEIRQKKKVLKSQPVSQTSLQKKESPIKNVIFNNPATIIEWFDGTKTIVKCDKNDKYDKATGLALCICKYIMGSGEFHKEFNKWVYGVRQPEAPAVKKATKKPVKKSTKTVKKVATTSKMESLGKTEK